MRKREMSRVQIAELRLLSLLTADGDDEGMTVRQGDVRLVLEEVDRMRAVFRRLRRNIERDYRARRQTA